MSSDKLILVFFISYCYWLRVFELWTSRLNFELFKIWALNNMTNNVFLIYRICTICFQLSIQQLPLCPSLFVLFSSEVLNSDINNSLDGVLSKMQFLKNISILVFGVFAFSILLWFFWGIFSLTLYYIERHIVEYICAIVLKPFFPLTLPQ